MIKTKSKTLLLLCIIIASGIAVLVGVNRIPNDFATVKMKGLESNTTTTKQSMNSISNELLKSRHLACFSKELFSQKVKRISLPNVGHYAFLGDNVSNSVRYDHLCPMMKPRYNCAKKEPPRELGSLPTDWKLVLRHDDSDQSCDLWSFIHDIGGPVGIAEKMIEQRTMKNKTAYSVDEEEDPVIVMMHGNSYLRQIFEALACGWSADVTDLREQRNAKYGISIAALKKRNGTKIGMDELGNFTSRQEPKEGSCRSNLGIKNYFEEGVSLPLTCTGGELYNDDIAMVEFGGKIQFYYVFRPNVYANISGVYKEMFNLNPKKVDRLVFNNGEQKTIQKIAGLKSSFEESGAWQKRIIWDVNVFKRKQEHDIGRWFGADNPWIDKPPDPHPCMPGVPDDEVNLLLFLLYSNATLD